MVKTFQVFLSVQRNFIGTMKSKFFHSLQFSSQENPLLSSILAMLAKFVEDIKEIDVTQEPSTWASEPRFLTETAACYR